MAKERVLAVIPARYGSSRFPGKPLAEIAGVPMVVRVMKRARRIRGVDSVVVATDDLRIAGVVEAAGGTAVMTAKTHRTGTSRVIEAAAGLDHDIIINVQGDEPLLPLAGTGRLIDAMIAGRAIVMGTLATPSVDSSDYLDPDVVKVVRSLSGDALYFSRAPLPGGGRGGRKGGFLRHVGVYAFRRDFLLGYDSLPRGPLEKREGLEQLRALENGYGIRVVITREKSSGVDRPGDIKRVEKLFERG